MAKYQIYPGQKVMATWMVLLVTMASLSAPRATAQMMEPAAASSEGPIDLYLYAEYAPGLSVPARPPQLTAKAITSKRISCSHRRATTISSASATVLEASARKAKCVSAYPLNGGMYNLLASYIEGANWATWKCYKNAPAASGGAVVTAAAPAEVPLFSSQAVNLAGGNSYTCTATYTPLTAAQKAEIAAMDWNSQVTQVAAAAVATVAPMDAADSSDPSGDAGITPAVGASCPTPAYTQPPRGKPAAILDTQGAKLINQNTKEAIQIRGLNWFGFNVDMGMVDGLWAGGSDATTDFSTIVYQIRQLGYNAVRLPFAHRFLAKTDVWDLERECTQLSQGQMRSRLMDPQDSAAYIRKILPGNASPMPNPAGKCNTYLPKRNNQDRLLFTIQQFVAQGMYVVLDYQPQGLEQHAYNLNQFVTAWSQLWKAVACLPNFYSDIAGRVLVDVMNEPDSMGIRWEASGDRPGAEQLYLATADALHRITPNRMLFMFEGTGQNMIGLNWGNGFVTDKDTISSRGLSNPTSFFEQVVTRPWVKKAVFSPHLYPPTITMSTWLGKALWEQSNLAFGYLQSTGYCNGRGCTQFPILVGETGSAYKEETDKVWLQDFADYAFARGAAAAYNKVPLNGWMWWAYNENSGDTGGIVTNQWQDLHWDKLRYMMRSLDLQPWYKWSTTGNSRRRPTRPASGEDGLGAYDDEPLAAGDAAAAAGNEVVQG
uniref:Glycoside hydrolase family 5 domain-containing protein n=1 Tax=Tetradesmus obliquus TaxID=3088 RepID=A0A383VFK3_TETOB|eukprot:jgi/Sobl393_1/10432/SZX63559.1